MIAVDTNVVVRFLTNDDPKQAAAAKSLFANETIWVAKTVLLETAWVLRSQYGYADDLIASSLVKLLGFSKVVVEDEASVDAALSMTGHGIGLADALHLASRPSGTTFVSFDRALIRRAQRAGVTEVAQVTSL
jgi:predicted nucleic-acid-binding protein